MSNDLTETTNTYDPTIGVIVVDNTGIRIPIIT